MSTSGGRKKSPLSSKTQPGARTPPPPLPSRSPSRTKTPQVSKTPPPPETRSLSCGTTSKADEKDECSVRVVVHVRPLVGDEVVEHCRECIQLEAEKTQVTCCGKNYPFDKVYGACNGAPASNLFRDNVRPLVDALYEGYNATVFAYGQTGSGETFTMGSAFTQGETAKGVIQSVLDRIFERIHDKPNVKCTVRATFVEIYKEGIRDLLASDETRLRLNGTPALNIREVAGGGVCIVGANEHEVKSKEEVEALLMLGAQVRATASTSMNVESSRSHAIFTITLEQQKQTSVVDDSNEDCDDNAEEIREKAMEDDFLTAKMHLVDLAGSESVSKAKVEGERLQEGIDINRGLLALGKVITSLVGRKTHVPYRDSKLTRLLQDSLGGNSRTVMIACVSPADIHIYETSNTLSYASRARKIKNKPMVNRDPVAAQLVYLRQQIAKQRQELALYQKEENTDVSQFDPRELYYRTELDALEIQCKKLEDDKCRLKIERDGALEEARVARKKQLEVQSKYSNLKAKYREARKTVSQLESEGTNLLESADNFAVCGNEDIDQAYLEKISELERENRALREFKEVVTEDFLTRTIFSQKMKSAMAGHGDTSILFDCSSYGQFPELDEVDRELNAKRMEAVEEETHRMNQYKLSQQIKCLELQVESTQEQRDEVMVSSRVLEEMKQHYEEQVHTLESKRQQLEEECEELNKKLQNLQTQAEEELRTLEQEYQRQLKEKEKELKYLKRQEEELMRLRELLKEAEETREKLTKEIERKKVEKAQLTKQMEENEKKYIEKMDIKDKRVQWLEEENEKHLKALERKERIYNMQEKENCRKVEDGKDARIRLQDINKNLTTPPPTKSKGTTSGTTKYTKAAPPTPDEKSQKEWLERELDACNQEIFFQTIRDSEIGQRRHTASLLRAIEARLRYVKKCISKDPSSADSYLELVETLQKTQKEYNEKMEKNSEQIEEYQTKCAETKRMEGRPVPNFEAKPWPAKFRSLTDTKELFKALFMIAGDLKVQSYQHCAEKARLEQEFAEVEEKLETSEYQIKDLTVKLERTKAAFVRSANFAPKMTTTNINNAHVVDLIKRLKHRANAHNDKDMSDVSSDNEDTPAVDASSLDLESESGDTNDGDWKNSSKGGIDQALQNYTPEEEARVLHYLNVRLARRGDDQAQELTIPLMTQELMLDNTDWERGKKTRNALVWECTNRFMPRNALTSGGSTRPKNTSSADGTAISHNTSRQTKESQKRYEDTMQVEDGGEE